LVAEAKESINDEIYFSLHYGGPIDLVQYQWLEVSLVPQSKILKFNHAKNFYIFFIFKIS
jgi:hypothetical protein